MPIQRTDARIPLLGSRDNPLAGFVQQRNQEKRNDLLEASTAATQQNTTAQAEQIEAARRQAAGQAQKLAEFESIVRGVNELEPLIPTSIEGVPAFIKAAQRRSDGIRSTGANSDDTDGIIQLAQAGDFESIRKQFNDVREIARQLQAKQLGVNLSERDKSGGPGAPAALETFNALSEGLSSEDKTTASRIQLGLDPRAVGTGTITTATTTGLTDLVANSQETIEERKKFGQLTGSSRANKIDSGFTSIESIDKNVRNIDKAIVALENGASTGVIESRFFPSFRAASVTLDQIQGELALDVVGSVTFGALSKGELDLAREVALPTGLEPPQLLEFLQTKKTAQEKLRNYYVDQIDFLDQGGTVAGFLRQQTRNLGKNSQTDKQSSQETEQSAVIDFSELPQ